MSVLSGLRRVIGIVPSSYRTGAPAEAARNAGEVAAQLFSGLVPGLPAVNELSTAFEFGPRKATTMIEKFMKTVPVVRWGLNPELDLFGKPVKTTLSQRIPGIRRFRNTETSDPVYRMMAERGASIKWDEGTKIFGLDKTGALVQRDMTPEELYKWTREAGPAIYEDLARPDIAATLATLDDDQFKTMVGRFVKARKAMARLKLQTEILETPTKKAPSQ